MAFEPEKSFPATDSYTSNKLNERRLRDVINYLIVILQS